MSRAFVTIVGALVVAAAGVLALGGWILWTTLPSPLSESQDRLLLHRDEAMAIAGREVHTVRAVQGGILGTSFFAERSFAADGVRTGHRIQFWTRTGHREDPSTWFDEQRVESVVAPMRAVVPPDARLVTLSTAPDRQVYSFRLGDQDHGVAVFRTGTDRTSAVWVASDSPLPEVEPYLHEIADRGWEAW